MSEAKRDILQWVESNQEQMIQFLQELVAIPSDNPPGDCYAIAEHIHKRLIDFQFENVQLLDVDEAKVKASGMIRVANVLSTTAFGEEKVPRFP